MISDMSEASERAAIGTFPYLIWKGSIMVTYLLFLIGSAKKRPPGWRKRWRKCNGNTKRSEFCFIFGLWRKKINEKKIWLLISL